MLWLLVSCDHMLHGVQAVKRAQADHKAAKESMKQCGLAVNSAKREIDHVTSALGVKQAEGVAGKADVLDSEEHQLLQTLKSAKIKFKRWPPSLLFTHLRGHTLHCANWFVSTGDANFRYPPLGMT